MILMDWNWWLWNSYDYDLNWLNFIFVCDGGIMFQKVQECDLKGIKWLENNDYKFGIYWCYQRRKRLKW